MVTKSSCPITKFCCQMAQNNVETQDHPLVFHSSPVSLQVLASTTIATHLLRHKITTLDSPDRVIPLSWLEDQPFSCVDLLQRIPSAIAGLIDDALKVVLRRVLAWVQEYSKSVFPGREERAVIAQILYEVEIDEDDVITGRRLLACDKVTPEEKYTIACMLCLEEDIVRLWPSVEKNTRISEVTCGANQIVYYWNCMMKKVPAEVPGNPYDSIELRMIRYYRFVSYLPIVYFWGKLTNEERTSIVDNLFIGNEKILINLLPKLNHIQAKRVLGQLASEIIFTLAKRNCDEYVVQIWIYLCEFASVEHQFQVLLRLFELAYLPANSFHRRESLPANECFRASEILYELWIRAPDALKSYVTDNFVEEAFDMLYDAEIMRDLPECYNRDMRFLLELLGRVDLPTRNRLWCENWNKLIITAKPEYLVRFMKMCFETDEQIVQFKESKMIDYDEVDMELLAFVEFGFFDELSEYIRFCSTDPTRVENLRRRIIGSQFHVNSLLNREKCQKFVKFIDDTFETTEQASIFKEEFLLSPECEMLKQVYDNLDKGCVQDMVNIRYFLYSKKNTDAVKQECLSHCRKCLIETKFMNFNRNDWKLLVFWCCETWANWCAFRRSLPIDEIFEKLLTKVIKGMDTLGVDKRELRYSEIKNPTYEILLSFSPVDDFFLWLYVKQDIVDKYKEAKLKNRSSKVIRTMLQKNWGKIVDTLLMWFLNNDKQRVEEIKADCIWPSIM